MCSAPSIDHMECVLYSAQGGRECFGLLLNVVRHSLNVSLFTGILSFVPREPVDFRNEKRSRWNECK